MKTVKVLLVVLCVVAISGCLTPKGNTVTERQAAVQEMKTDTLNELYAKKPETKGKMDQAVGYGVFSKRGAAFLIGGSANGFGTITDKQSGKETYMRAFTGSAGLGFGIKNFRLVIIFYDPEVMDKFVTTGWDFGTQASATMTSKDEGGEVAGTGTFSKSMDIYEFTKEGVFLRAAVNATRFYPDKNMNIK